MELKLNRPLLFFDIESTGLNIATDGIIELSFVKVMPEGGEPLVKTWRIKPWDYRNHRVIPISPSASEVNGIKDEDLVNCPKFIEVLPEVAGWLAGSDLAGFNSTKFDLPLLAEEIERVRDYCNTRVKDPKASEKARAMLDCINSINLHDCKMVDVQNIYHHMEPRNLRAAYRFYCGGKDSRTPIRLRPIPSPPTRCSRPNLTATRSLPSSSRKHSRTTWMRWRR